MTGYLRSGEIRAASALAAAAGLAYLAIGVGFVPEGFQSPPPAVMLVAAACYLGGALIIPRADRRVLIAGAVANALVMALFLASAARGNATVSSLTLAGKIAQAGLEVLFIAAIARRERGA